MENYFIKAGYVANELNITNDEVSNEKYWDRNRITSAEVFQFPVYQYLCTYLRNTDIKKVIDIGCGVGRKLVYVNKQNPDVKIIGIDQEDPIKYCKSTYSFGEWYSDDFENSQLSTDIKSELIICSDVIEHLINPDLLLNYIKSKLEVNGVVIISTPERDALRGKNCNYSPNIHHIREWNFKEFEKYLESRGFEVIDHFLQYPIKMKFNVIFYHEIIKRALKFKHLKYNQVVVAKVR